MGNDTITVDGQDLNDTTKDTGRDISFDSTALNGYFKQSDTTIRSSTFEPKSENFGLIHRSYKSDDTDDNNTTVDTQFTDWQRFERHISQLNASADPDTTYRVLYLARHGQGYHNVAHTYYGNEAWDCYYSALDGDPESELNGDRKKVIWRDAHLTPVGIQQAKDMSSFWRDQITNAKIPIPQSFYVSPMDRACRTAQLTWSSLAKDGLLGLPDGSGTFRPLIKELLRECNGLHTCDSRSSRSYIAQTYPEYVIEDGFTEEDELFDPALREPDDAMDRRMRDVLDDILRSDASTYISITAHAGCINGLLRALGHRAFNLAVGSALPVLIKAVQVSGKRPKETAVPWEPAPKGSDGRTDWNGVAVLGSKYGTLGHYIEELEKAYQEGNLEKVEHMGKRVTPS